MLPKARVACKKQEPRDPRDWLQGKKDGYAGSSGGRCTLLVVAIQGMFRNVVILAAVPRELCREHEGCS
jgi:hypothetical protein